jgi:hypothetical protein
MSHFSCCLLVDDGKILLSKELDLPTSGIKDGETTEKAAVRIASEAGVDAEIDRFFALEFFSGKQIYTYLCKIKNIGRLSDEYNWYNVNDIENKQLSENLSAIIDKIKVIL